MNANLRNLDATTEMRLKKNRGSAPSANILTTPIDEAIARFLRVPGGPPRNLGRSRQSARRLLRDFRRRGQTRSTAES